MLRRVKLIDVGIEHIEAIGVPQRRHEPARRVVERIRRKAAGQPRRGGGIEEPAHGVRALLFQHLRGADDVAQMLAHLVAVLVLHMPQHHAVFKGSRAKDERRNRQKRIEPAARLVDRLGNEIGREAALEFFLVFEGVVPLREGHGARIVPAVDDLLDAVHRLAAVRAFDNDVINVGTMQLRQIHRADRHVQQLLPAADDVGMPLLTLPDGQRRAPVTLARKRPIHHVFKEIPHAAFLDVVGHPVDLAVVLNQLIPNGGRFDEPAAARVIQQRRIAAPAMGVFMLVKLLFKQLAAFL